MTQWETCALLFCATFVLVFFLGFQSLNVNRGHFLAAFLTSYALGLSNLVMFKFVPDAGFVEVLFYLSGGPFGIVTSMWAHRRFMPKRRDE